MVINKKEEDKEIINTDLGNNEIQLDYIDKDGKIILRTIKNISKEKYAELKTDTERIEFMAKKLGLI